MKITSTIISVLRDHSISTYAKFPENLTFLTPYAYQGVRNVRFSKNFAYVLSEWHLGTPISFIKGYMAVLGYLWVYSGALK